MHFISQHQLKLQWHRWDLERVQRNTWCLFLLAYSMKRDKMCNNFQWLNQEIIPCMCAPEWQEPWWFLNVTWFNLRLLSSVKCGMGVKHRLQSRNTTESWSGARQRNPAEPSACRHFTQMSESASAQFSPGDSWERFARTLHSKTGS